MLGVSFFLLFAVVWTVIWFSQTFDFESVICIRFERQWFMVFAAWFPGNGWRCVCKIERLFFPGAGKQLYMDVCTCDDFPALNFFIIRRKRYGIRHVSMKICMCGCHSYDKSCNNDRKKKYRIYNNEIRKIKFYFHQTLKTTLTNVTSILKMNF